MAKYRIVEECILDNIEYIVQEYIPAFSSRGFFSWSYKDTYIWKDVGGFKTLEEAEKYVALKLEMEEARKRDYRKVVKEYG